MDASRRGDDRRQEGVTQAMSRVALPIFINFEREIKVLMTQGAIQRGVVSAAMLKSSKGSRDPYMTFFSLHRILSVPVILAGGLDSEQNPTKVRRYKCCNRI